jgi:hypothetical protein
MSLAGDARDADPAPKTISLACLARPVLGRRPRRAVEATVGRDDEEASAVPGESADRDADGSPTVEAVPPGARAAAQGEADDPDAEEDGGEDPQEVQGETE